MISPYTNKQMIIMREERILSFRKESFNITFHYYLCQDTGEEFEDKKLADINFNQVINKYREKYNIPFAEEIVETRKKYKVSASKMSEILGFGPNTYGNYEKGEVPNQSNGKLIRASNNPNNFLEFVQNSNVSDKEKIIKKINERLFDEITNSFLDQLEAYALGDSIIGSQTGFKKPNFTKMQEMIIFFAEKMKPYKTKLNKLLFYSDFLMYRETGFSITGGQYRAIQYGPVPKNFDILFNSVYNNDLIDYSIVGENGEKTIAKRKFNPEIFSDQEIKVLELVSDRFLDLTVQQTIDKSHDELGWIENIPNKGIIDYSYAFKMNDL